MPADGISSGSAAANVQQAAVTQTNPFQGSTTQGTAFQITPNIDTSAFTFANAQMAADLSLHYTPNQRLNKLNMPLHGHKFAPKTFKEFTNMFFLSGPSYLLSDMDSSDGDSSDYSDDYELESFTRKLKAAQKLRSKKKDRKGKEKDRAIPTVDKLKGEMRNVPLIPTEDQSQVILANDHSGYAVKCILCEPSQPNDPYGRPPSLFWPQPPVTYPNNISTPDLSQRSSFPNNSNVCFECGKDGHMMQECLKLADYLKTGVIKWDNYGRKYTLGDGPSSNYVSLNEEVESYYNNYKSHHYAIAQSEDSDSDYEYPQNPRYTQ
ncbi:hypothetical protein BDQ17DRAFT_1432079 [Cyathus striatus]|nr:hypothetical protein BDQ17DRAFT_1432079 [Cyathus striatus]